MPPQHGFYELGRFASRKTAFGVSVRHASRTARAAAAVDGRRSTMTQRSPRSKHMTSPEIVDVAEQKRLNDARGLASVEEVGTLPE
jgi:hypothetical protein